MGLGEQFLKEFVEFARELGIENPAQALALYVEYINCLRECLKEEPEYACETYCKNDIRKHYLY